MIEIAVKRAFTEVPNRNGLGGFEDFAGSLNSRGIVARYTCFLGRLRIPKVNY